MSATVFRLCLVMILIAAQQNASALIIPTYLQSQGHDVASIGTLVALVPLFSLAARFPAGLWYRSSRAIWLMLGSLLAVAVTNTLFGFARTEAAFIIVSALNGLANGVATTVFLAVLVLLQSIPAGSGGGFPRGRGQWG